MDLSAKDFIRNFLSKELKEGSNFVPKESVAANLAQLPVRAQISLRADGGDGLFTVDAGPDHRLQFRGLDGKAGRGKRAQLERIEDIEVIGIRRV